MVKPFFFIAFLLILTLFLLISGLFIGSFETNFDTIFQALFHYNPENNTHYSIFQLRLPRLLLAFIVGGSLSLSGYMMQAMVNNPLADPYILGTAAGAGLGANIVFFGFLPVFWLGIYMPSLFAFLGALIVTALVVRISYQGGKINSLRLLLGGVAISSLLTSVISLLTFLSDSEGKLRSIIFWIMGSFEKAQWSVLPIPLAVLIAATLLFFFLQKQVSILFLGEEKALQLGLNTNLLKWLILVVGSLVTGVAVASSGAIGFVGLMIPHFIRGIFGVTGRFNAIFATLSGGAFMLACDLLARIIYPPAGLPVGIITSFLGIPFFLYLIFKRNYNFA